ncbi:unnamed protein product [Gulo gulo]|uniref:Uncharacterized protein n=1 Tax=Gulo gulo TaxID=48420 RepID=A0A9X9M106_GULGU|nr:unnamed protein product [Gulo gulo]
MRAGALGRHAHSPRVPGMPSLAPAARERKPVAARPWRSLLAWQVLHSSSHEETLVF